MPTGSKFCSNCGAAFELQADVSNESKNPKMTYTKTYSTQEEQERNVEKNKQAANVKKVELPADASTGDKIKEKALEWWSGLDVFCKITTVMMGIVILFLLIAMIANKIFPIAISVLQLGGIVVALLIHKGVIKLEQGWIKYITLAAVALFMVFNIMSYSWGNNNDLQDVASTNDIIESSEDIETESSTETDSSVLRESKNGFDSATNEIYEFAAYTMEIPSYWTSEEAISDGIQRYAETGGKVAMLQVSASEETDSNYDVTFDGLMADNDNMILTLEFTAFDKITDYEVIDTGNVKGILYTGTIEYDGCAGTGQWFEFASEEDRNWCAIVMSQTDNTEYNYDDDFEKMIYSIKRVDSSVDEKESISADTEIHSEIEELSTEEIEELPTEDTEELTLETVVETTESVAEVVLPASNSKLGKDYDSKGKTTVYYINIDGTSNIPELATWASATVTDGVAEYLNELENQGFTIEIISTETRNPYTGFYIYDTSFKVSNSEISWTMDLSIQDERYVEYELDVNMP